MIPDVKFLLWCGEKFLEGEPLSGQELILFRECHERQKERAHKMLRIKEESYRYEKGKPFPG